MFYDVMGDAFVEGIEQNLAARKLVRDFFTDRARARQARPSTRDGSGRTRNSDEDAR
jgi:hypothetical protein